MATNNIPSADIILKEWLTSDQAIEFFRTVGKEITSQGVSYLCRMRWEPEDNAVKIGAVWYIRPETVRSHFPNRASNLQDES